MQQLRSSFARPHAATARAAAAGAAAAAAAAAATHRTPSAARAASSSTMTKTPPSTAGTGAVFPEQYEELLQDKVARVKALFAAQSLPEIEVHRSSPSHFRMRTEFRVWHEGPDLCYVMFEQPVHGEQVPGGGSGDNDGGAAAAAGQQPSASGEAEAAAQCAQQQQQQQQQASPEQQQDAQLQQPPSPSQQQQEQQSQQKQKSSRRGGRGGKGGKGGSGRKRVARVRIEEFPVASQLICSLMPLVRAELLASPALRTKLFQVNFHTTLSNQAMITMNYHAQLDDVWQTAAEAMRARLLKALGPQQCAVLHVIGRSHKQKVMLDADHVTERMEVAGRTYEYMQVAGCFSQPNGGMCQQMLGWAVDATRGSSGDLLELYCGNGNFTLPLAQNFKQVVATEISKASVVAARHNIAANRADNIFLARMSSEEFVETWRVKGSRNRLAGLDWDALELNTLLVDPPRAGLDPDTEALLREFDQVVYISCNPETLASNLKAVAETHSIERFAVFDQFPYTDHLECGALLRRRRGQAAAAAAAEAPGMGAQA